MSAAIRMVWLHTRFLFCQGCCEHFQELLVSTTTVEDLGSNPVWELANSYVDLNSDGSKDRKTHKAWETECNLTAWWMNLRACSPTFLSFRHSQSWPKSMKSGQIPASFWTKSSRSRSRVEIESKSSPVCRHLQWSSLAHRYPKPAEASPKPTSAALPSTSWSC